MGVNTIIMLNRLQSYEKSATYPRELVADSQFMKKRLLFSEKKINENSGDDKRDNRNRSAVRRII